MARVRRRYHRPFLTGDLGRAGMMARPGTREFRAAEGFEMAKAFTKADAEKHKALTARGWELTSVHLLPYGQEPSRRPGAYGQWHLRWAARCFERALEIHPEGWPSMWALGKIYQLLGDLDMAFLWFAKANAERPNHPDLVRDAGRAAMDVGAPKKHWRCVGRRWLSGQMIRCWSAT